MVSIYASKCLFTIALLFFGALPLGRLSYSPLFLSFLYSYCLYVLCVFIKVSLYTTLCPYINVVLAVLPHKHVLSTKIGFSMLCLFSIALLFWCSPTRLAVLLPSVFKFPLFLLFICSLCVHYNKYVYFSMPIYQYCACSLAP